MNLGQKWRLNSLSLMDREAELVRELELDDIIQEEDDAGVSAEFNYIYKTLGQDVILPCGTASRSDSTCSIISWLYVRDLSDTIAEVENGNVEQSSSRAARLSLDSSCSLLINNITAEDTGRYTCRERDDDNQDVNAILSVLTTSSSPPDADPKRDGDVTILCSLSSYNYVRCQRSNIRWVNETGAVLPGQRFRHNILRHFDCTSVLTVKRQSGHNRRYTCQVVNQGKVRIKADYTPVFTRGIGDDETEKSDPGQNNAYIIGGVVGGVILLAVIAAVLIRLRKKAAVTEDVQKPVQHTDEADSNLTYVTVSHANQRTSPKKKKEEEVTYSTVKTSAKPHEDIELSALYSTVNKPK
ncbi:uncharacterized protein LOC109138652 isoform X4 [Larimichthys crocea]|uniref:uncharacterized protein LOC109138652 isoform X4 n=1 Tax=Larimichthys crocea TaxID=215358 RepID=UPI000F5EEE6A|nr:uncharacterized protein LOC109138652 isoform X4 [Larimichthys crocea]